jgi:putative transcriptional regulator
MKTPAKPILKIAIEPNSPLARSKIKEAVHETAAGLHRLVFVDQRRMRQYDALYLQPVPDYDAERIKALRSKLKLSQSVLASVLNTSVSKVRKWEASDKHPSGSSSKLLNLLERKGLVTVI